VWLPTGQLAADTLQSGPLGQSIVWRAPSSPFNVALYLTVRNQGRYAVTVDRVLSPWQQITGLRALLKNDTHGVSGYSGGTPMHPFHLGPSQEQVILLRFRMACNSISSAGYMGIPSIPVEFEFLGVHHRVSIDLRMPLRLTGPSSC
jgi:hypothetical protein